MRNEEKIYLAISEVDDALIEEASAPYKVHNVTAKRIIAIAASAAIITAGVIGVLHFDFGQNNMAGDYSPGMSEPNAGGSFSPDSNYPNMDGNYKPDIIPGDDEDDSWSPSIEGTLGTLTLIESDGVSFKLMFTVCQSSDLPVDVYLYSVDYNTVYTTAENVSADNIYHPTITVNGEPAEKLPTEIGEYTVSISFDMKSEINTAWENFFTIDGFGNVYID